MTKKDILDIGEVAAKASIAPSKLRYYEAQGLIHSVGRRGLRRLFNTSVLERLALISLGQFAGFSLKELKSMLPRNQTNIDRKQLLLKADEVDKTIRDLKAVSKGLRHAAKCQAPSHLECPKFRQMIGVVNRKMVQEAGKVKKGSLKSLH